MRKNVSSQELGKGDTDSLAGSGIEGPSPSDDPAVLPQNTERIQF